MRVVLVHPPFFRLVGSHNNKCPVELSFLRGFLEKEGCDTELVNGDFSGAISFWRWKKLYDNFQVFRDALTRENSTIYEVAEYIMSLAPDIVVISAGDTFLPTVIMGSPFVSSKLSQIIKANCSARTVAMGTYHVLDSSFDKYFDAVVTGGPNADMARDIIACCNGRKSYGAYDPSVSPYIRGVLPYSGDIDYSYVAASKGCAYSCEFCITHVVNDGIKYRMPQAVRDDIFKRMMWYKHKRFYLTDMVFPTTDARLQKMVDAFRETEIKRSCSFICEARVDSLDDVKCRLLREMNVDTIKLGVEVASDEALARINKKTTVDGIKEARERCKRFGFNVVAYLLLGGGSTVEDYKKTLKFCEENPFDSYVVNFWSFHNWNKRDYRFDTHFSPECADYWKIPRDIIDAYFELQEGRGNKELKLLV